MTRGIRKGLTPDRVLDAAFAIVDIDGPDALTMRRLAADLGVAAMAIYNHFADRDAVLDAIAERAFSAPPTLPAKRDGGEAGEDSRWRQRVAAIVLGVHSLAVRHPHIYRLSITRPTKPESALRLMSEAMEALREAGLSDPQCVTVYHTIVTLLQGFPFWLEAMQRHCAVGAAFESTLGKGSRRAADWHLVHSVSVEEQFNDSLEWLLDAIEHSIRPRTAGRSGDPKRRTGRVALPLPAPTRKSRARRGRQ